MKAALYAPGLSTVEKMVLITLADHVNEAGECWPSLTRLSDITGISRRSVVYAVNRLVELGMIQRINKGKGISTRYRLLLTSARVALPSVVGALPDAELVQEMHYGSARDALGLVQEMHPNKPLEQTNEQRGDPPPTLDAIRDYEAPDPERQRLVTAISEVVSETFWEQTQAAFFSAAEAFQRDGVTAEQIRAFPAWWKRNSYYKDDGKPALKTLVAEMRNCRAGVSRRARANGHGSPDVGEEEQRVGGVF